MHSTKPLFMMSANMEDVCHEIALSLAERMLDDKVNAKPLKTYANAVRRGVRSVVGMFNHGVKNEYGLTQADVNSFLDSQLDVIIQAEYDAWVSGE